MSVLTISAERVEELRQQGKRIDLIDVRGPLEFGEVHAAIARNIL